MTKEERQEIKKLIQDEILKTTQLVQDYKLQTKPISPENSLGRISRMDAINNKSVVEAALRTTENKLKGLNIALAKVDNQDFGICGKCSNPIPIGRILLVPHGRFCVHCAH